jgi:pimeloyl-ACP methyl ester carboxylesterase
MKSLKYFLVAFLVSSASTSKAKIFSAQGLSLSKSPSGRSMVYDYKPGRKDTVWVFIHGLGDEMSKLQGLAELAEQEGYGILRMDLQGHGFTLKQYLKTHQALPVRLNFEDNVQDIQQILLENHIQNVVLVGHSYGGGIAYALAAELRLSRISEVKSLHMLAPYVQRIDKFLKDYYQSPEYMINQTADGLSMTGVSADLIRNSMQPFFSWIQLMTAGSRFIQDQARRSMALQAVEDQMLDPLLQGLMEKSFQEYLLKTYPGGKWEQLTDVQRKELKMKVEAAIRVTKGIRSFDLLDTSRALPVVQVPLQILGGKKDSLVLPAQLQELDRRLTSEKVAHQLEFMEGPASTHLFPRQQPKEVFSRILEFQKKSL